jgi:hypothetical protein
MAKLDANACMMHQFVELVLCFRRGVNMCMQEEAGYDDHIGIHRWRDHDVASRSELGNTIFFFEKSNSWLTTV